MPWDHNLSNLRNILAGLYWSIDDGRRVAQDAGLNPIYIAWSNNPTNMWQHILEHADKQDAVGDIIRVARKEYPKIKSLELAEQHRLLTVELDPVTEAEWQAPTDSGQLEVLIGPMSTLLPISFLEKGLQMSRSVGRIVLADNRKGTGFLIGKNLLLTNHHVISSQEEAEGARVEFNYQKTIQDLDAPVDTFHFAPAEGFATSSDTSGDDWTMVRLAGNPGEKWGILALERRQPKAGERATIIQHPGGEHKQIALYHSVVVAVTSRRIQYLTDTLEGSSGSPVFDTNWRVIALHHKGGLHEPNAKNRWRNQGVHINTVLDGMQEAGIALL